MDALDAAILRELGVEPFAGWGHRPLGLRATDVAKALGRSIRLIQDRITRMEKEGIIQGYAVVPNPRHFGMDITTFYVPTEGAIDASSLRHLSGLDGFVNGIAYLGKGICYTMSHGSTAERDRRIQAAAHMVASPEPPKVMYEKGLPEVDRELSRLDWRIITAVAGDGKRAARDVAAELGVTVKTVRTHWTRMREEGSIDEVAIVDFTRMNGVLPFEIPVWLEEGTNEANALAPVFQHLRDNYWGHFIGPADGFCDILMRVFSTSPGEAHDLVASVARLPQVARAEALMAGGMHDDQRWLNEAIAAKVG